MSNTSRMLAWLALLLGFAGCKIQESHARCQTDTDCSADRECYRGYCVIRAVREVSSASSAGGAASDSQDAATATVSEAQSCARENAQTSEPAEGACCSEPAACYMGPPGTLGVGACRAGTRACTSGRLGPCTESVTPHDESCENEGSDDDCDGVVDNVRQRGADCTLSSGYGECGTGKLDCSQGMSSLACVAVGPPAMESCNDRDEDCDGKIDEDFDISTDAKNCGTCSKACASSELCCAGTCLAQASASASGCPSCSTEHPCKQPAECCGGACRDLQRDRRHCGACGHSCEQGLRCCAGSCKSACE